jgi:Alpha galactosidase A/Alpha galactosidase C-terminal beta sandwich domain/Ricin-type beta-trefoil lectin domain
MEARRRTRECRLLRSDDCWAMPTRANGGFGPQVPNPEKFPNGWPPVVQYINSKGLKAGLYTARAPNTCAGFAGSCLHELIDAQQYIAWGIEYLKDDNCGTCGQYVQDDYFRMQSSINFAYAALNRTPAMVLSIEGDPGANVVSAGGHGNMLRVGHDISPTWLSMTSLIDIGSGLWSYAHTDTGSGSFWNDLDMLEVGNEPNFVPEDGEVSLQMAQAHMGMWAIMKAPLIIGNNMYAMGNLTQATLTNAEVIAINQDSLGVQAQRVGIWAPSNLTLTPPYDAVALLTLCNASVPTQTWQLRSDSTSKYQLLIAPCNASNANQQWVGFSNASYSYMRNLGVGECVDASASSGYTGGLGACNGGASQFWYIDSANHVHLNGTGNCLDVFDFTGPTIFDGSCKPAGDDDSNQVFSYSSTTHLLTSALPGNLCAEAASVPGGQIWTTDASGTEWCLDHSGYDEGGITVNPCSSSTSQVWIVAPMPGGLNNYTFTALENGAGLNWNTQVGASGPIPHSRWLNNPPWGSAGQFTWNPSTGGPVQANSDSIINDNGVGSVTIGGDFCLDAQLAGYLEMWAGPLSGNRYAVALFNRTPNPSPITAPFNLIPGLSNGAQATFSVRNTWQQQTLGTFTGSFTTTVPAHAIALLVLTPA